MVHFNASIFRGGGGCEKADTDGIQMPLGHVFLD